MGHIRSPTIALVLAMAVLSLNAPTQAASNSSPQLVEFEMMTWPEVQAALAGGKTTALIYTGGTEQRGPHDVNGGHTLMGRATVKAIAEKLGNAIAMPVLPYTPNRASAELPGTIGLTNEILGVVLERLAEESIATGFKNVILMGDHGGGQGPLGPNNVYDTIAKKLDAKFAPKGIHVYYSDRTYAPAANAMNTYLATHKMPVDSPLDRDRAHGGITDTSEMLYLEPDGSWVRKDLLRMALGDPALEPGQKEDPAKPKINNGITGDARPASKEIGKIMFDIRVDYAVKQYREFIPAGK